MFNWSIYVSFPPFLSLHFLMLSSHSHIKPPHVEMSTTACPAPALGAPQPQSCMNDQLKSPVVGKRSVRDGDIQSLVGRESSKWQTCSTQHRACPLEKLITCLRSIQRLHSVPVFSWWLTFPRWTQATPWQPRCGNNQLPTLRENWAMYRQGFESPKCIST